MRVGPVTARSAQPWSAMRRDARVDTNHRALLDLARTLGGVVVDTKSLGQGAPDAFVLIRSLWHAVEIKTARGRPTPAQAELHVRAPVLIWRTPDDVLAAFRRQRREREVR